MAPITINEASLFWDYLEQKNRYLYLKLRSRLLAAGDVVALKPASMSDELYDEYKKILDDWLNARGLLEGV